ncbi:hypothetical protein FRC02_007213 [Tulasnella sp. 418]|nr:hypothetical protein FRC02_007213 [Tulasnella sp. 418]
MSYTTESTTPTCQSNNVDRRQPSSSSSNTAPQAAEAAAAGQESNYGAQGSREDTMRRRSSGEIFRRAVNHALTIHNLPLHGASGLLHNRGRTRDTSPTDSEAKGYAGHDLADPSSFGRSPKGAM